MTAFAHQTVLLEESVQALQPRDGALYVDCTLGGGGHTELLLASADCTVIGIDRDPMALDAASERLARFGDRFLPWHGTFDRVAEALDGRLADGLLADLGVSSPQLDLPERGFSFRASGPIDMRMDPTTGEPASTLVDTLDADALADLIYTYGEERNSRRIARAIVAARPLEDTAQLAEVVKSAMPGKARHGRIHPATRTFQALRIAVNDELGQLERLLDATLDVVAPGGRIAIISFHSLEDRLVKRFFASESGKNAPRDPWGNPTSPPRLRVHPSHTPSSSDPTDNPNPRARSARLRVAERLPWNAP